MQGSVGHLECMLRRNHLVSFKCNTFFFSFPFFSFLAQLGVDDEFSGFNVTQEMQMAAGVRAPERGVGIGSDLSALCAREPAAPLYP